MKNRFSRLRPLFQSRKAGRSFADDGERDTPPLPVPQSGTTLRNPSRQRWGTGTPSPESRSVSGGKNALTIHIPATPPSPGEPRLLPWTDIRRVTTFKRDLLTTDLLYMQFFTTDGTVIEIHEEMPGFDDLRDILPDRLPGFPPRSEWYPQVIRPPFAVSRRVLWEIYTTTRE